MEKEMKQFRDFESAREFARKLELKNSKEWAEYCKSGNKPDNIPATPWAIYEEWKGSGDFLGTGTVAPQNMVYQTFDNTKKIVQLLKLKSKTEWYDYCKSGKKSKDIPMDPRTVYKKEWKGWGDWLGTGRIANQNKQYRPFKDAREFVRSLGLKSTKEWLTYCASGNKPEDIPVTPWDVYKEWKKKF